MCPFLKKSFFYSSSVLSYILILEIQVLFLSQKQKVTYSQVFLFVCLFVSIYSLKSLTKSLKIPGSFMLGNWVTMFNFFVLLIIQTLAIFRKKLSLEYIFKFFLPLFVTCLLQIRIISFHLPRETIWSFQHILKTPLVVFL